MHESEIDELDARCILPVIGDSLITYAQSRSNHRERQADLTVLDAEEIAERNSFVRKINSQLTRKQRAALSNFLTRIAARIDL
tara:strand:+ start:10262 stop:10510 length:249 start_codon:yes stop_codon:yes gene_type:complete